MIKEFEYDKIAVISAFIAHLFTRFDASKKADSKLSNDAPSIEMKQCPNTLSESLIKMTTKINPLSMFISDAQFSDRGLDFKITSTFFKYNASHAINLFVTRLAFALLLISFII